MAKMHITDKAHAALITERQVLASDRANVRAGGEATGEDLVPNGVVHSGLLQTTQGEASWKRGPYASFVGCLVKEHGFRVAEFLWRLNAATATRQRGSEPVSEFRTAQVFGAALGISDSQFYSIAKKAVATGYTTCKRVCRGTQCLCFSPDWKLAKLIADERRARPRYPFTYHTGLARHVSINAAILYNVIHRRTADERGMDEEYAKHLDHFVARVAMTGKGCEVYFPWMTRQDVSRAMRELLDLGLITREPNRSDPYSKWLYRVARQDSNRTPDQVVARLDAELATRAKRKEREAAKLISQMKSAQKDTSGSGHLMSGSGKLGCP